MKKIGFVSCVIAALIGFSLAGCVPLIVGGALGAAGGYVLSKDTIQGVVERSYDKVWEGSISVLKEMGASDFSYSPGGKYRTYVGDTKINIKVVQMSDKEISFTVSARKNLLPRLKLAEDIFVKVIEQTK